MIQNKTKNKILTDESKLLSNPWEQSKGLMFSKKKGDYGLIFDFGKERQVSLHMFFVFYSIDVLFLDSNKKVVDMKQGFKPFTTYTAKKRVKYVLELPNKVISLTNTSLGDLISIK
ncbi:DUF192 domain-containing protein [archaeon]|nr:DUF192 domain-containing protein [archaeon]MBL7057532.1 DUF192 domain-containing protein [Candidatus Woesearchaeota archaeon]